MKMGSIVCLLLLTLIFSPDEATSADSRDLVIHEGDGLWVLRQPWTESASWCRIGSGNPAHVVHDVYAYYDSPHERRMERLGESYESFVRDKVLTGIRALCGSQVTVTRVIVGMYKKPDTTPASGLVDDLYNSKTPIWDIISFELKGKEVQVVNYEAKDAVYHLSHAEVLALDPRKKETVRPVFAANRIADYPLYGGDGFSITSVFDRPGRAWCEHVYVPLLVTHEGSVEALDELIQPDYVSFLEAEIVPKIKAICPSFPNANEYVNQSIRLEFVRAGESRVMSTMGFAFGEDGALAWWEGRQTTRQVAAAAAKREEKARLAAEARRERDRRSAAAQRDSEARQAARAAERAREFMQVECSDTTTGYMHTNTLVPYVKMSSRLSTQEIRSRISANDTDIVDCFESLTTVLQGSNPYATAVKFDILDNTGKLVTQGEFSLTPKARTQPVHEPERLTLFTGFWQGSWFEIEIFWDWAESRFLGVVTNLTPKGRELGFKVGDEVLSASVAAVVYKPDSTITVPAKLKMIHLALEGALGIQLPPADFMVFWEGKGDNPDPSQVHFERVEKR